MAINIKEITNYLKGTQFIVLSTVDSEGAPALRTLGAFGTDELTVFFSTSKDTEKVEHLNNNDNVSVLFQHENQQLAGFKNVTIKGKAKKLVDKEELDEAIGTISKRNPRFKERVEKQGIENSFLYKIQPKEIKYLDFQKGIGTDSVSKIDLVDWKTGD